MKEYLHCFFKLQTNSRIFSLKLLVKFVKLNEDLHCFHEFFVIRENLKLRQFRIFDKIFRQFAMRFALLDYNVNKLSRFFSSIWNLDTFVKFLPIYWYTWYVHLSWKCTEIWNNWSWFLHIWILVPDLHMNTFGIERVKKHLSRLCYEKTCKLGFS